MAQRLVVYQDDVTGQIKHSSMCILGDLNVDCYNIQILHVVLPSHFRQRDTCTLYVYTCAAHKVRNVVAEPTRFWSTSCLDVICITSDVTDVTDVNVNVIPDPITVGIT